jgi:MYXO-CTERM domain-containing protein
VAGGYGDGTLGALNTAELYDPATGTFSSAGTLSTRRAGHGAVALSGGRVLLFGGHNSSVPLSSAEIFQQADLAGACTAGYECSSGNCVDAHCCESASCPMDSTCVSGKCAKKGATGCTMGSECSSGFCVDGFCCDKACDGQCEACNNSGKEGVCSPATGAPHGSRAACTGTIVGGECGSQCDGTDSAKCNYPTSTKSCGSRGCLDGVENTVGTCDGSGRCSATPRTCGGYACQGDTCGTACETDAQCLTTHKCQTGKCVTRGATCSSDNASVVESDGKITSCGMYACKGGVCQNACAASTDCVGGAICDGSGKCVQPPTPATGDDGGCSFGHTGDGSWFALLAAAAVLGARSRKRPA